MSDIFVPGTTKPEEDYKELERLSTKLGIPVPMMMLKVEVTNPDGSTEVAYEGRSRTFNRNYWNMLFLSQTPRNSSGVQSYFGEGGLGVRSYVATSGAEYIYGSQAMWMQNFGGAITAAADTNGIVVGTGTKSENFEDTSLNKRAANGTGTGQISYTIQADPTTSYNSSTKVFSSSLVRVFNNNSASSISISETGIYVDTKYTTGTSVTALSYVMICRDLLGSPVTVAVGGQLTVTYTWQMTMPTSAATTSPFSDVKLILGNESGSNGTSSFSDQSSYAASITTAGTTPTWSSTYAPTGLTTSIKSSGAGVLVIPDSASKLTSDDWSIEFLFLFTGSITSGQTILAKRAVSTDIASIRIYTGTSNYIYCSLSSNGTSYDIATSATLGTSLSAATWYYFSVHKIGKFIVGYRNGTQAFSTYIADTNAGKLFDNGSSLYVFGDSDTNRLSSTSYIASLRICEGSSRKPGSNLTYNGSSYHPNVPTATWTLPLSTTA